VNWFDYSAPSSLQEALAALASRSDALALALRLDAPVYAEAAMFDRRKGDESAWHRPTILALDEWKARA